MSDKVIRSALHGDDQVDLEVGGVPPPKLAGSIRRAAAEQRLAVASGRNTMLHLGLLTVLLLGMGTAAVLADFWLIWICYWAVAGFVLTSCFAGVHEALHGSLFDSPALNHFTGMVTGALTLVPYSTYRAYHFEHHLQTHEEGDTEPIVVVRSRIVYLLTVCFAIVGLAASLWGQFLAVQVGKGSPWATRRRRTGLDLGTGAAEMSAVVAAVVVGFTFGWRWPIMLWLVPLAVYFPLAGIFAIPEHYECDYGPGSVFRTTRTVISNRLVGFCQWNANYHTAHHLLPAVPGHNVPRLHVLIASECEVVERSYLRYHIGVLGRIGRRQIPPAPPWSLEPDEDRSADRLVNPRRSPSRR